MATSGTIGMTTLDATTCIEHAARRCGVTAPSLSAEQQQSAKENLFFILSDLANRGVSLWCVQRSILGLAINQATYNLPLGTVDILRANYRTCSFIPSAYFNGSTSYSVTGQNLTVNTIGVLSPTAQTFTLVLESSPDGVAWSPLATIPTFTTTPNLTAWFDIDPTTTANYFRVRETVRPTLDATTVQFGYAGREIPMSPLNRDDYADLPNKTAHGRPLEYWYDKQYLIPQLRLWPTPNDATAQIVVWNHRQIQDVGSLSNTLEIPQRWYEAIIFLLAAHVALELPPEKLPPGRLEYLDNKAKEHLSRAEDGETDGAPFRVNFGTGVYTR